MNTTKHTVTALPDGYVLKETIDLQKDRKTAIIVNGLAVLVMVVLFPLGSVVIDIDKFFESLSPTVIFVNLGLAVIGPFIYLVLHELTHGIFMKYFGAEHVKYGFTGLYAYASSKEDYFDKFSYTIVSLAPLTVWFVIFTVLMIFMPRWMLPGLYFLQVTNISGSMGDVYISTRFRKLDPSVFILDPGVSMSVFVKETVY